MLRQKSEVRIFHSILPTRCDCSKKLFLYHQLGISLRISHLFQIKATRQLIINGSINVGFLLIKISLVGDLYSLRKLNSEVKWLIIQWGKFNFCFSYRWQIVRGWVSIIQTVSGLKALSSHLIPSNEIVLPHLLEKLLLLNVWVEKFICSFFCFHDKWWTSFVL